MTTTLVILANDCSEPHKHLLLTVDPLHIFVHQLSRKHIFWLRGDLEVQSARTDQNSQSQNQFRGYIDVVLNFLIRHNSISITISKLVESPKCTLPFN